MTSSENPLHPLHLRFPREFAKKAATNPLHVAGWPLHFSGRQRCIYPKRLESGGSEWEIPMMDAVKVDDARRIRLKVLKPGDYYEPEFVSADEITLRRVEPPKRTIKLTKAEVLRAVRSSKLTFRRSWEIMRQETREL